MKIAVLGGTGKQGSGLALRWAKAGHQVLVGSRTLEKAVQAATELNARPAVRGSIAGLDNPSAAAACEAAVLAVPYSAQASTLLSVREQLSGKLLISVVAPLKPPRVGHAWRPEAGSAAQEAHALLGDATPLVIAFQNISAELLADTDHEIDSDVLICGDGRVHLAIVEQLVRDAGLRPVNAGPLVNASVVEGLTAVLVGVNARYKTKGAGIRITGLTG
jgi:NADPH-dependent F420 reductase